MIGIKKWHWLVLPLVVFIWSGPVLAADYVVSDELLYMVEGDKKTQVDGAEVSTVDLADGKKIYWVVLSKETHKVPEGGIYFFGAGGEFSSILNNDEYEYCDIKFSPDGEHFVLDSGTSVNRSYDLYVFDGLEKKKHFSGFAQLEWIDEQRFVFNQIDESKKRSENADIAGWVSVASYDTTQGLEEITIVLEATPTADFIFSSFNSEAATLTVTKLFVKSEKDWADAEKVEQEEIEVPTPAAG